MSGCSHLFVCECGETLPKNCVVREGVPDTSPHLSVPLDTLPGRRAARSFAFFHTKYGNEKVAKAVYSALSCRRCGSIQPDKKGVLDVCKDKACGWKVGSDS